MMKIIEAQQMQKEIDDGAQHELAGLLGRILMAVVQKDVAEWFIAVIINLHLQTRSWRAFEVEMMAFDNRFDSRLLQIEFVLIACIDSYSVGKPEEKEKGQLYGMRAQELSEQHQTSK